MQTTTIEQNRARDYERYEAHRRFEEATDIAERIGYPIDHTVGYEMRDGLAYGEFDTKDRPFHAQTEQSLREGREMFTGVNRFEVTRREHEHQEALMIDKFGRGELDGNVLVKISPVPDAVRDGIATIDGYRRDMLRSFVRIYYRTDKAVECRLFSLDQSDHIGLAAVGDLLGIDTDGRSSEDILGDHALMNMSSVSSAAIDRLVQNTIDIYDGALEMQTGGKFHAGSRMPNKDDALSMVMRHGSLLDEHMREISGIMTRALSGSAKKELLEQRRIRTTAAIDLVVQGGKVDSSNDAAVSEQISTKEYGGDCPTGYGLNAVGMAQGARKEREFKKGVCLACLKPGKVGECSVCIDCEERDNRGVDLMKVREKALAARATKQAIQRRQQEQVGRAAAEKARSKSDVIKSRFGEYARVRNEFVVGGMQQVVYDYRTGETIAQF
jgi:hypothetical protein